MKEASGDLEKDNNKTVELIIDFCGSRIGCTWMSNNAPY